MSDEKQPKPWISNPWTIAAAGALVTFGVALWQVLAAKAVEGKSLQESIHIILSAHLSVLRWVAWPGLGFGLALALLISLIVPKFRRHIWVSGWKYVSSFRFLSGKKREAMEDAACNKGYAKRSLELEQERITAARPEWRIFPKARDDEYCLYNWGYEVGNVRLDAPQELFEFIDMAPWWKGAFGNNSHGGSDGRFFYGRPTAKGRAEGVTFTITWFDQHKNAYEDTRFLTPEGLNLAETPEEAYKRGYVDGLAGDIEKPRGTTI